MEEGWMRRRDAGLTVGLTAFAAVAVLAGDLRAAGQAKSVPAAQLGKPDAAPRVYNQDEDYLIGPFDVLDVSVFQVDLLTRTVQVDAGGHIQYPMIGEVAAAGKTAKQVGEEIAARLDKSYLRSPQVTVSVKDSASQKYTVEGSVKSAGVFPLQGHMTLLKAIATAQGASEDAKLNDVVIFRMVNQQRVAGVVNLGDVGKGKVDDPVVYAGDVIVVPQSASRRVLKDIIGATPLLLFLHP
jgi:polysaccharide export outer membrane protein